MQLYHDYSAEVFIRFGLAYTFDATSAALQRNAALPHISILLVVFILRQSLVDDDGLRLKPAIGLRHPAVIMSILACADYVAITPPAALKQQ